MLIGALALAVVGGTLGLYWFQPWKQIGRAHV